jgi:hypothetical protein
MGLLIAWVLVVVIGLAGGFTEPWFWIGAAITGPPILVNAWTRWRENA